jgi:carboxymethylenebutenolidase
VNVPRINPIKNIALGLLVVVFALASFAAEGNNISYNSGGETVQGMLYTPPEKGPFPAIIVIQEYWGLNECVKEQASKLSDQGYVALAVDLYRGRVADNPELAHELMRGLPEDRAKRDLHAAFEFLQTRPRVKKDRIGSIGWCMGGGYSDVALQEPTLAADVIHCGHLATDRRRSTRSVRLCSGSSAERIRASRRSQ